MNQTIQTGGRVLGLAALLLLSASWAALAQRPPIAPAKTTTQRPDQFGTDQYTVTVIQAGSFTADTPTRTHFGSLRRDFGQDSSDAFPGHFYAGVSVPAGIVIDFVGLQSYDWEGGPGIPNNVATLFSVDRYSGTTSGVVSIPSTPNGNAGTDYNSEPLGFLWTQNAHQALVLDVYLPGGELFWSELGGLIWVEIWWKRAVSPAPDTPSFTDVPTTDFGFQFIEALKASGITGGCGDGSAFCPNATLTRRQMAIFLAKALGLHWPN